MGTGIILCTEDSPGLQRSLTWKFKDLFELQIKVFATNDAAWKSITEGNQYSTAVIDYHTPGVLTGADLIVRATHHKDCGEPLVLSSSANRTDLTKQLKKSTETYISSGAVDNPETFRQKILQTDIFDKNSEGELAILFIAGKLLFPEITRDIKRSDLLLYFVSELRDGEILHRGSAFEDYLRKIKEKNESIIFEEDVDKRREQLKVFMFEIKEQHIQREHERSPRKEIR